MSDEPGPAPDPYVPGALGPWEQAPPPPPGYVVEGPPAYGVAQPPYHYGAVGAIRGTGVTMLLYILTCGLYGWYWFYVTHEEMKRHTGEGLGGGVALLLAIFVSPAVPFLTSDEVGRLYERRGQAKPVSAQTGLWNFPGAFILVGPIIWFVKTNDALNAYWRSLGAA